MKFLVTGGAGFIGSHLAEKLAAQGETVRILDNLETGKQENLDFLKGKVEFIHGDIRDLAACKNACQGMDYVLHHAALGSVPRSVDNPLEANAVNVTGTLNMLVAARDSKVKRLVFASSSSIYGDSPTLPKVETMPPRCISPYGLNKYAAETYASLFYRLYGFETISLRYFNVFGPRQDPLSQYAAVIPRFVTALIAGKRPEIYGDGEQARDFTFVDDVVRANILACKAPQSACGEFFNIACNRKITLNELFREIKKVLAVSGKNVASIEPVYSAARAGDIKESLADYTQAKVQLGFSPQVSFVDGIAQTVQFFAKG